MNVMKERNTSEIHPEPRRKAVQASREFETQFEDRHPAQRKMAEVRDLGAVLAFAE